MGAFVQSLTLNGLPIFYERKDPVRWRVRNGGSCVLIPYADLVKDGEYTYNNRKYKLPKNGKYEGDHTNSIHGTVLNKEWVISLITPNSITLNTNVKGRGFPSTLFVTVNYEISDGSFSTMFLLKNVGDCAAPVMCGAHPYFIFENWWKLVCAGNIMKLSKYEENLVEVKDTVCDEINANTNKKLDEYYEGGGILYFISQDRKIEIERFNMPFFGVYNGVYCGERSVNIKPLTSAPNSFNNQYGLINLGLGQELHCGFKIRLIS